MDKRQLIYIPYHDEDNYYEDGILTRESAVLYMLYRQGFNSVISVKKPRTVLDKKRYKIIDDYYPDGTVESEVRGIFNNSTSIQYTTVFSMNQILLRRTWWVEGYKHTEKLIEINNQAENGTLVYSDNPFAFEIIKKLKKNNCRIYFDAMDNFAIHPSLNARERNTALKGYREVLEFADYVSANSEQTCEYLEEKTGRKPMLIKNGVFVDSEASDISGLDVYRKIKEKIAHYQKCVGYIGKLGARIDADLIDTITKECEDVLFVLVGPYLKDQKSRKLMQVLNGRSNILLTGGIPSAYIHSILDQFDLLIIPHAVGEAENGGDPEKLYHYLTRKKPILTTGILGVGEFKDEIEISNEADEWVDYIKTFDRERIVEHNVDKIGWEQRFAPMLNTIKAEFQKM